MRCAHCGKVHVALAMAQAAAAVLEVVLLAIRLVVLGIRLAVGSYTQEMIIGGFDI